MFAKNDPAAHPSNKGGWDQPREWGPRARIIVGIAMGLVIVAVFIGIFLFTGDNADELAPEVGAWRVGSTTGLATPA